MHPSLPHLLFRPRSQSPTRRVCLAIPATRRGPDHTPDLAHHDPAADPTRDPGLLLAPRFGPELETAAAATPARDLFRVLRLRGPVDGATPTPAHHRGPARHHVDAEALHIPPPLQREDVTRPPRDHPHLSDGGLIPEMPLGIVAGLDQEARRPGGVVVEHEKALVVGRGVQVREGAGMGLAQHGGGETQAVRMKEGEEVDVDVVVVTVEDEDKGDTMLQGEPKLR